MPPSERDRAYLWDMLQAARDAAETVAGKGRAEWDKNKLIRLAVERSVEIIGEAARHVSKTLQKEHPEIPWSQIIGLRNILAHEYGQIDYDRLFETATRDIPRLIEKLSTLVPPLDGDE